MQEFNLKVELLPSEELKAFLIGLMGGKPMEQPIQVEQTETPQNIATEVIPEPAIPMDNPAPVSEREYTLDEISLAATSLMAAGNSQVLALLPQFNITQLSALPKEKYPEFALELRKLGAKI